MKKRQAPPVTSCEGKERFTSAHLAHRIAARRNKNRAAKDDRFERQSVYRCGYCGHWHLGHTNVS